LGTTEQPPVELYAELCDSSLRRDARFWVETPEQTVRSTVPLSVQAILQEFLDRGNAA
jgi:hypothetical protein